MLYHTRQPAPKGNRVAIITNAGGPGVVTTDLIEATGLCTAQLSEETKQTIAAQLPRAASVLDPIDVLGDAQADRYAAALEAVMKDSADVDAIVVLLTPQIMTQIEETARVIAAISKKHTLPIVCAFVGQHDVYVGKKILRQHEIPCYAFPRQAVAALGRAYQR